MLFWCLEGPFGLPGDDLAKSLILVDFPHESGIHFGVNFGTQNSKVAKKLKKVVFET